MTQHIEPLGEGGLLFMADTLFRLIGPHQAHPRILVSHQVPRDKAVIREATETEPRTIVVDPTWRDTLEEDGYEIGIARSDETAPAYSAMSVPNDAGEIGWTPVDFELEHAHNMHRGFLLVIVTVLLPVAGLVGYLIGARR